MTPTLLYSLTEIRRSGLLVLSEGDCNIYLFIAVALLLTVGSYLLGSVNFAIYISKAAYHKDIRNYGSGNAGMTNMMRTFGTKAAVMVLLGDIMKSFVSVTVTMLVCGIEIAYIAGVACVVGHCHPIYYGFRGGKGIATAAGMILAADPFIFVACIIIFVLVVLATKFISAGSIMTAMLYPLLVNMFYRASGLPMIIAISSVVLAFFVIFNHRENISRILKGEEKKFRFKKSVPTDQEMTANEEKCSSDADENGETK